MQVCFDMPASMAAIDPMTQVLRDVAEPFLDLDTLFGFEVSVSEALTNIVRHTYSDQTDTAQAKVQIRLKCEKAAVTLELQDQGKPIPADLFNNVPKLDDIDLLAESGRGLALIKHYAETVNLHSDSTGNHLHLRFITKGDVQS